MLLMTRDGEKFRSINTANLSVQEIKNLLGNNEKIGFASYIWIKPHYFGFACSSLSPKFDAFADLINEILNRTDNGNLNFCVTPLVRQATKDEAVSMEYIGRTTIEVTRENSLAGHFLGFLGVGSDCDELDGLEITIKPKHSRNIKPVVEALVSHISDEGLKKLIIKAKNDASSAMLDLYVAGRGVISDMIDVKDDALIAATIEERAAKNANLQEQIREYISNGQTDKADFSRILRYCDESSWASFVEAIQVGYQLRQ